MSQQELTRNPTISIIPATSGQIHSVTYDGTQFDRVYTYEYDKNGNIVSISDGTNTTTYVYDSANQLLQEKTKRKTGYGFGLMTVTAIS